MSSYLSARLDIASTLDSGQTFAWQKSGEWYIAVISGLPIKIRKVDIGIEYECAEGQSELVRAELSTYFRLSDNLDEVYETIGRDKLVNSAIELYSGMRITYQDPWECLMSFICSANSNIQNIHRMVQSLSRAFGKKRFLGDNVLWALPTSKELAAATEQDLRNLRLGFRAKYLYSSAQLISSGVLNLNDLRSSSYAHAKETLTSLDGVGNKIADCVMLFSIGKLEAFPIDRWIKRCLTDEYKLKSNSSYESLGDWAREYFGRYAGYAQQYMFHHYRTSNRMSVKT